MNVHMYMYMYMYTFLYTYTYTHDMYAIAEGRPAGGPRRPVVEGPGEQGGPRQ